MTTKQQSHDPPRIKLAKKLRRQGRTYQYIGDYLGVSRQRAHQMVNRVAPQKSTVVLLMTNETNQNSPQLVSEGKTRP